MSLVEDIQNDPILERKEHDIIAVMRLSGEQVEVGILKGNCEDTPYIKTSDNPEPVYMNCHEAQLLISALELAIFEANGEAE